MIDLNKTSTWALCQAYVADLDPALLGAETISLIQGWIRARSLKHLASCCELLRPIASQGPEQWRALSQIEAMFKKNTSISAGVDTDGAALANFHLAERMCRITNRRLDHFYSYQERLDPDLRKWIPRAERFIEVVLGDPEEFVKRIPELVRLTSGATATRPRKVAQPYRKVSNRVVCGTKAFPMVKALRTYFGLKVPTPSTTRIVDVNRVMLVLKNWKTKRVIAAEADDNLPLQLAFDSYGKSRLKKMTGINLRSQKRNQQLAREGSLHDTFATVDFSMASDTVAYNAVAWLLPHRWVELLDMLRATHGSYEDPEGLRDPFKIRYAKFSSMGNGCTFVLETLIFAALAYAVGDDTLCVYGDDVVIRKEFYEPYCKIAKFFGFRVNRDKSYASGPFRESCGENYFLGRLVTPFFLRDWCEETRKGDLCHAVNGLASISLPEGKLWDILRRVVQDKSLPLVPWCESTVAGVHVDVPTSYALGLVSIRNDPRHRGWLMFKAYVPKTCEGLKGPDKKATPEEIERLRKIETRSHRPNVRHSTAKTYCLWWLGRSKAESSEEAEDLSTIPTSRWSPSLHRRFGMEVYSPFEGEQSSSVPVDAIGYKRDWVSFQPRLVAEHPLHLFWWTEWVTAPPMGQTQ